MRIDTEYRPLNLINPDNRNDPFIPGNDSYAARLGSTIRADCSRLFKVAVSHAGYAGQALASAFYGAQCNRIHTEVQHRDLPPLEFVPIDKPKPPQSYEIGTLTRLACMTVGYPFAVLMDHNVARAESMTGKKIKKFADKTTALTPVSKLGNKWRLMTDYFRGDKKWEAIELAATLDAIVMSAVYGQKYVIENLDGLVKAIENNVPAEGFTGPLTGIAIGIAATTGIVLARTLAGAYLDINWGKDVQKKFLAALDVPAIKNNYNLLLSKLDTVSQRLTELPLNFPGHTSGMQQGLVSVLTGLAVYIPYMHETNPQLFPLGMSVILGYAGLSTLGAYKIGAPIKPLEKERDRTRANLRSSIDEKTGYALFKDRQGEAGHPPPINQAFNELIHNEKRNVAIRLRLQAFLETIDHPLPRVLGLTTIGLAPRYLGVESSVSVSDALLFATLTEINMQKASFLLNISKPWFDLDAQIERLSEVARLMQDIVERDEELEKMDHVAKIYDRKAPATENPYGTIVQPATLSNISHPTNTSGQKLTPY